MAVAFIEIPKNFTGRLYEMLGKSMGSYPGHKLKIYPSYSTSVMWWEVLGWVVCVGFVECVECVELGDDFDSCERRVAA